MCTQVSLIWTKIDRLIVVQGNDEGSAITIKTKTMIYVSIILATLFIQIPNIWAIKQFNENPGFLTAFVIALYCLPASFLSTGFFAYYYGKGYESLSYPAMAVMAYGFSLLTSFTVSHVILRTKTFATSEIVGGLLILAGIAIIVAYKR